MQITIKLVLLLLVVLISYGIGRRVGIREGMDKGMEFAPINLRKDFISSGRCPICNKDN